MAEVGSPVESVDRALRIIQVLGHSGGGFTLEELANACGIPKSSLHRTLAALKYRGFAAQPEENGRYFMGSEILAAAFSFYDQLDLPAVIRPLLVRIRDEFNETVHMAVLEGRDVVYLDKVESPHPVKLTSVIGGRNPAHCTGVGKALLAWTYPTDEAVRLWVRSNGPLESRTRSTITSESNFVQEMARTRERGYALDREESEEGVRCIALPIFLGRHVPVAAASVSAPSQRLPDTRIREIAPKLAVIVGGARQPPSNASG